MSVKLAEGVVEVRADGRDISRSVARDIESNQGPLDDAGRRSAGTFGGVFKGSLLGTFMGGIASDIVGQIGYAIGAGIRSAVEFGIGSINLAGSLEQSIGAVDAVFGGNAGTIHDWAKNANSDVGLTRNAYSELATVLGSQLKNGGTAIDEIAGKTGGLITLGADMSAMFGGTTADAVGALSAALRGERDTIERYGVSLTQAAVDAKAAELGFEKVDGVLSQQATQAATLALVYDQTAAAQGRFAAEGDTYAGKQARLSATFEEIQTKLGTALLPALTTFSDFALNTLIPIFDDLVEKIGPQLGGVLEEAAPALAGMFEAIAPHIPGFIDFIGVQLPAFLTFLGDLVAFGADVIGFFDGLAGAGNTAKDAIRDWFQTMSDKLVTGQEQVGTFFGDFGAKLSTGAGQIGSFVGDLGARFGEGGAQIGRFAGVVGEKIGEAVTWVQGLPQRASDALGDLGSTLYDSGASLIQGFLDGLGSMWGAIGDTVGGIVDYVAGFFPNSPAKRGAFSGAGWTALGRSGSAIAEQFQGGINRSNFGIPFTAATAGGPSSSGRRVTAAGGAGSSAPIHIEINEATDPLGSAARVSTELRKWRG